MNPLCMVPGAASLCLAGGTFDAALGGGLLGPLAEGMVGAWWTMQGKAMTWWTAAPTLSAADLAVPGPASGYAAWLAQFLLVCSLLAAAARTALTRDGHSLAEAARAAALTVVASAGAVGLAAALLAAGDAVAEAVLAGTLDGLAASDPQPVAQALLAAGGGFGPGGALLLGILGALAALVQFFVLLARNAVLPVVVLMLPLAAAGGGAAMGRAWFGRLAAWLLALAFYKPVAAVVYAVVLAQAAGADTAMKAVTAFVGMVLAIGALPALLKMLAPATAGAGSAGGGYATGMAAAAAVRGAASRVGR